MYDLYTWATPNGFKVSILLEELGEAYNVIPVNIGKGDQFAPDYLKINPNNKMPTLVDPDGPEGEPYPVFESGAILMYLADKHGKFLPKETGPRYRVIQWLMFQMGGVGPMLGQAHHFLQYAPEKIEYAMNRYGNEANRIYGVLERRLKESPYLAGDEYTIADMAVVPWIRRPQRQNVDIDEYPATKKWRDAILDRPAVQKGCSVLVEERTEGFDEEAKKNLFGSGQYEKR
jgi:GST-like protein